MKLLHRPSRRGSPQHRPLYPKQPTTVGTKQWTWDINHHCAVPGCRDYVRYCEEWKNFGECERNRGYMIVFCRKACSFCPSGGIPFTATPTTTLPSTLPLPPPPPPRPSLSFVPKVQKESKTEQKDTSKRLLIERVGQVFSFHTKQEALDADFEFYDQLLPEIYYNICNNGVRDMQLILSCNAVINIIV